MATRRQPRTLQQVSHLFLSSGADAAERGRARAEGIVWIVAAGRSANRAHLAAGAAAALARQNTAVSVCELSGNLPNVGYYFGLEPADYLATAIDRKALVTGTWNGSVRFASSPTGASLASYGGVEPQRERPHVVVAAATAAGGSVSRLSEVLESFLGAFSLRAREGPARPDAILVASGEEAGMREREMAEVLRARQPEALLLFLGRAAAPRPLWADERFVLPDDLARTSHRRSPPESPWFGELAAFLVQRLGSRRRRSAGAVNE